MKKSMKMLLAAFLFVLVLAPVAKVEAAGRYDDLQNFEVSGINLGNPTGAYSGGSISNLQQTAATETSITLSWTGASGAARYYIYQLDNSGTYADKLLGETSNTTYTISNLNKDSWGWLGVIPVDAAGEEGSGYKINVATLPSQIKGVKYNGTFAFSNKLSVLWKENLVADGYRVTLYDKTGKKVKQTLDVSYNYLYAILAKTNTQNIYIVRVKAFIYIKDGEKAFGSESQPFYAVPQPKITSTNKDVGTNGINLKWKKVNGATKYDILVSTQAKKGYKKAATVKKGTKYSVISYNKKPINTLNKTYYAKIITYAKFGKKVKKSQNSAAVSFKTKYEYR